MTRLITTAAVSLIVLGVGAVPALAHNGEDHGDSHRSTPAPPRDRDDRYEDRDDRYRDRYERDYRYDHRDHDRYSREHRHHSGCGCSHTSRDEDRWERGYRGNQRRHTTRSRTDSLLRWLEVYRGGRRGR